MLFLANQQTLTEIHPGDLLHKPSDVVVHSSDAGTLPFATIIPDSSYSFAERLVSSCLFIEINPSCHVLRFRLTCRAYSTRACQPDIGGFTRKWQADQQL